MEPVKCRISEVANLEDKAILISFQHGELIPDEAHKVECGLYAHKKTGKRVVAVAVDDDHLFTGSEPAAESNIAWNLIAIRNKRTNKVRIIPTTSVMLSPVSQMEKSSSVSVVTQEDRDRLGMKFGSKKKQRILENYMRMRADADSLKDKLKCVVDSVSVEQAAPETLVNASSQACLPPINHAAATVDDVYSLYDIVSAEKLASLKEEAVRTMKEPQKEMFSLFFWETLPNVLKRDNMQEAVEGVCALMYSDSLIKFLKIPAKCLQRKKNVTICPYSKDIDSKIINTFTVQSPNGRLRPSAMRDKALCHLIVLGLLLTQFKLNLEPLSKSLATPVKRLQHFSRQVGAVSGSSTSSTVILKLPLPPLKQPQIPLKRKKKY